MPTTWLQRGLSFVALVVAASGCVSELPAPQIESVEPAFGYFGDDVDLTIDGENLFPSVRADVSRRGVDDLDDRFEVHLLGPDDLTLESVALLSYDQLSARLPKGPPTGVYDLEVIAPDGQIATLVDAYEVTDSRADHLAIQIDSGQFGDYTVNDAVDVSIRLESPSNALVTDALDIRVELLAANGVTGISILEDLEGQLAGGVVMEGQLDQGTASFSFTSSTPATVTILVEALDSPLEPADEYVTFEASNFYEVEITPADLDVVAGEGVLTEFQLRDAYGNALTDAAQQFTLKSECGGTVDPPTVQVQGGGQRVVTFYKATEGSITCTETRLFAEIAGEQLGSSDALTVAAGDPDELRVEAGGVGDAVAGEEPVNLRIQALDSWDNKVTRYEEVLRIWSDNGGLDPEAGVGEVQCGVWEKGLQYCDALLETAGEGVVVFVEDANGLLGETTVDVLAGEPAFIAAESGVRTATAGSAYDLLVRVEDGFGNPADIDPTGSDVLQVSDGYGTTSCSWLYQDTVGEHVLSCTSTTADPELELTVAMASWALSTTADPFELENGPLALADVLLPSSVVAGSAFTLSVQGYDAWGNPFETGGGVVALSDPLGTLSPGSVTLDASGAYSGTGFSITAAGSSVVVSAESGGAILGQATFAVLAGTLDHLGVTLAEPWVWVDEAVGVLVQGQDQYGNRVSTFSGPVTLSSEQEFFADTDVSSFSDGQADATLTWTTAGLEDQINALSYDGIEGSSDEVDALDGACSGGPTADLRLNSLSSDVTVCLSSGTATLSADFSSSSSGDAAIEAYHFHDGDGGYSRSGSSSVAFNWTESGGYLAQLVVVDEQACADITDLTWWIAEAGEPAGPLNVSLAHSSRTLGLGAADADSTVSVHADTCDGDVADAVELYVRTDLGELKGATPGTQGLRVTTDSSGDASLTWSAQNILHGGTATVHIGSVDGASYGSASLQVLGDSDRPTVIDVDPMGVDSSIIDTVVIDFSEEMKSTATNYVSVTDPDGLDLDLSAELNDDGDTMTLTFDESVDATAGTYAIELTGGARDTGGNNPLDGQWTGATGDFTSVFGAVDDEGFSMTSCEADESSITPDGNAGSGSESDELSVDVVSSDEPTWWLVEVYDATGSRVRTERYSPAGSNTDTLSWDARGDDGIVVAAGAYTIDTSTIDAYDNRSVACEVDVEIVERYRQPE